jgi:hypothetical protein
MKQGGSALVLVAVGVLPFLSPRVQGQEDPLLERGRELERQTESEAMAKSEQCLKCHVGIESMHRRGTFQLGCTDCHGGDAAATTVEKAHVQPRHPDRWPTAANPVRSYTLLNEEDPEFIRFVNPGDLRVADRACGPCHRETVLRVQKSMMTTSTLLWGGAAYNNGILSAKNYILGESYAADGTPRRINTVPPPTEEEMRNKGVLPFVVPLPRWEITQPGNIFRTFERGGKASRQNPSEIGVPNPLVEEPGRPDMKLGARGLGTELRISSPVLNLHKTRLNDPHLSFLGTNDHAGDYRSSGCTGCHVIYANDRSPVHAGPYAAFGNRGLGATADPAIRKDESGHPIKHEFTSAIPSSQCMVCHMHQPNAFLNTFYGFQMWDYETDGKGLYPETQRHPSASEAFRELSANPEEAVLRGNWGDPEFLNEVSAMNPGLRRTQFADYHGHGWIFRAVFRKDRKGNLLDKDGRVIDGNDAHKFHGVVPVEGVDDVCDEACRNSQKAVHLKDIHAERGMHCVDCHFSGDNHGNGNLYGEFHNAIEIRCEDCHGTVTGRASLRTSGPAAPPGGTDMERLRTPFEPPQRRFREFRGRIYQRSMIHKDLEWEVPQVMDSVDPASGSYNPRAARAKTVTRDGGDWVTAHRRDPSALAHASGKLECYSCHSSWITNCFGCHLPQQANWKKAMNHFEGGASRNWTSYNPQVIRDDGFMLGIHGDTKGNTVAPVRSSSALVLSSRNANREQVYLQQPPISAGGYSSQAFNPHFPHTVRTTETRVCTDCHLSEKNDNNAWMAQVLLHGTNMVNFMGKYVWVATGTRGLEAVAVTEDDEPQAVIGSHLQSLAYPDDYRRHVDCGLELETAYRHGGTNIRSLQMRGEYLFAANGSDGFRVYDVANIDNKGFSQRIVTAPVSGLGQDSQVDTEDATAVALPTTMPVDTRREYRPENREQPMHPLYGYAYITDSREGLILVDVMALADGDPRNNVLERGVTFNPSGILDGAVNLAVAGTHVYVCCDAGIVIVNVEDPTRPRVEATVGAPDVRSPRAVAVQFRYAFVCDAEGLKVIDVTVPESPRFVGGSTVPLREARDVYVARTYAYVAAGAEGLVIVDVTNPETMTVDQVFTGEGRIRDACAVTVGSTNASVFAYVADGEYGLKVVQLTSPEDTPGYLGFSPRPAPRVIAVHRTGGPALALSEGLDRDRAVDESGNQVSVFGRLGSRPFTLEEQRRLYLRDGAIWTVSDTVEAP